MNRGANPEIPPPKLENIHKAANCGKISSLIYHLSKKTDINVTDSNS